MMLKESQVDRDDRLFQSMMNNMHSEDPITTLVALIGELRNEQKRMADTMDARTKQIDEIDRKIDAHSNESNERHMQILNAFPSSDIDGHRRYHEAVIKRIELRNDIVRDCLKRAAQVGFIGSLIWLCKAVFFYTKGSP